MRKMVARLLGVNALLLSLSACKTTINSDIYLGDVYAVMADRRPIELPIEIGFEVLSEKDCPQLADQLKPVLAEAWSGAEFIGCNAAGFTTVAQFRLGSEMVYEASNKKADSRYPIYLGVFDENGRVFISYFINSGAVKALEDKIPEAIASRRSGKEEIIASATINNDNSSSIVLEVGGAFVDGRPIQKNQEFELKKRMKLVVKLSDVSNASLSLAGGYANIASVPTR